MTKMQELVKLINELVEENEAQIVVYDITTGRECVLRGTPRFYGSGGRFKRDARIELDVVRKD